MRILLPFFFMMIVGAPPPLRAGLLGQDDPQPVTAAPPAPGSSGWIGIIDPVRDVSVTRLPAHATLDPQPERNRVGDAADGHPFTDLGTPRFLGLGSARGTELGPDGTLRLAPGREKGAWLSPVHREARRFDFFQVGIRGATPAGSRAKVYVRAYGTNGAPTRWVRVRREREVALPFLAEFLQVLVILVAGFGGTSPSFGGVTLGTGVLGQGGAPPIFSAFPPGGAGGLNPASIPAAPVMPTMPQGSGSPTIIPRAQWGAGPVQGSVSGHRPVSITLHHSQGPNASYSGAGTVRGIQRYHQGTKGWADIGYHYLIGPDGQIFEGRKLELVGTHSPPNPGRVGICMLGDFESADDLSPAALGALLDLMTWLCRGLGIDPGGQVFGHKDQRPTDCPGRRLYPQIPALRDETRRRLGY